MLSVQDERSDKLTAAAKKKVCQVKLGRERRERG
jgi:hypothetical protein